MRRLSPRSIVAAVAVAGALGVGVMAATPAGSSPDRPTGDELGPVSEDEVVIGDAPVLPPPVVEPVDR